MQSYHYIVYISRIVDRPPRGRNTYVSNRGSVLHATNDQDERDVKEIS